MVNIARALTSSNHPSKFAPDVRLPYMVEVSVTAEQMIAAKGGAIASADVYDVALVPAGSVIRGVWARKDTAMTGTSVDLSLTVGLTGGTANLFVTAWDFDAAATGAFGPVGAGVVLGSVNGTATQGVSFTVAAQTGTWLTGRMTFFIEVIDLSDYDNSRSGIVTLGS